MYRLQNALRAYGIPTIITLFCIGVLYWGWHVSVKQGTEFARAGALVTALSLAFLFWHYAQILAEKERLISEEVWEVLAATKIRQELTLSAGHKLEKRIHTGRSRTERYITRWQAVIIGVGTLVWGFGDLVYQYRNLPLSEAIYKLLHFGA